MFGKKNEDRARESTSRIDETDASLDATTGRERMADADRHLTRSEEELAVGKERMKAGDVQVRKHVETEHVSVPVTAMHEEAVIERHPVNRQAAGDLRSEEISVPLHEERIVADKRAVVKEEINIHKRAVADTQNVEADLRKERIDLNGTDNVRVDPLDSRDR